MSRMNESKSVEDYAGSRHNPKMETMVSPHPSVVYLRRLGPVLPLLAWLLITAPAGLMAAATGWQAGLARTVITPTRPVSMGGFAQRDHPSTSVVNDLYVKALALTDDAGHRAVLITCDTIGFRANVAEQICTRIMQEGGLKRSEILLNSSHTHTGPSQSTSPEPQGGQNQADARALYEYTVWLQDQVVATALRSLTHMQPVTLAHATGVVKFPFNRREYTARGVILGVNPSGPTDRSVPVLKVTAGDGSVLGVVFGAACHNTTIPALDYAICGDFAGFAQQYVEEKFSGSVAMFMQGCGGDTTPYPTGSLDLARAHGAELGQEVERVLTGSGLHPVRGPLQTKLAYSELPLEAPMSLAQIEEMARGPAMWKKASAAQLLVQYQSGIVPPTHYRAPIALWQFGADLKLLGLSGEVVADYVALAQKVFGPVNLWVAGYCNDVFGYLPNTRILQEGGYETRGLYSGRQFAPGVEHSVEATLNGLAKP